MAIDKSLYGQYKNQFSSADDPTEEVIEESDPNSVAGFGYNSLTADIYKSSGDAPAVKATELQTKTYTTSNGQEHNYFTAGYNEHATINENGYRYKVKVWDPKTQKYRTEVHSYGGDKLYSSEDQMNTSKMKDDQYLSSQDIMLSGLYTHNNEMKNMLSSTTITSHEDGYLNRFNKFARYGSLDPTNMMNSGCKEYIFFSKPDLHLFGEKSEASKVIGDNNLVAGTCTDLNPELKNVPFFQEMYNHYRNSMYSLQQNFDSTTLSDNAKTNGYNSDSVYSYISKEYDIDLKSKFMNILSNNVNGSLELPGITASEQQNNQNLYQIYTTYREGSEISDMQHEFSLEFQDTKYLDTYMLFKIYDEYFRMKYYLNITPTTDQYILNKIYPEAFSIWKIIVDDTGRIVYWCKLIGVTPMSVPRESITTLSDATISFSVNFKAQFVREMDPVSLLELNKLVEASIGSNGILNNLDAYFKRNKTKPIYDNVSPLTYTNGDTWVKYPYVYSKSKFVRTGDSSSLDKDGNPIAKRGFYKLVWI